MSQLYEPARATGQIALVQGINLRAGSTINANNAAELQRQLRASQVIELAANPGAELVDCQIAGSGPGNVFGGLYLVTVGPPAGPPDVGGAYFSLNECLFTVLEGATQADVATRVVEFLAANPDRFVIIWDQAIGGSGSPFVVLLVTIPNEE